MRFLNSSKTTLKRRLLLQRISFTTTVVSWLQTFT